MEAYFKSRPDQDPDQYLQKKADSRLLEKAKHMPKFNTMIKHLFMATVFPKKFLYYKLEGVDFKHDNSLFKFQPKNPQIRKFWSPK